jgi:hypothetical protein
LQNNNSFINNFITIALQKMRFINDMILLLASS